MYHRDDPAPLSPGDEVVPASARALATAAAAKEVAGIEAKVQNYSRAGLAKLKISQLQVRKGGMIEPSDMSFSTCCACLCCPCPVACICLASSPVLSFWCWLSLRGPSLMLTGPAPSPRAACVWPQAGDHRPSGGLRSSESTRRCLSRCQPSDTQLDDQQQHDH